MGYSITLIFFLVMLSFSACSSSPKPNKLQKNKIIYSEKLSTYLKNKNKYKNIQKKNRLLKVNKALPSKEAGSKHSFSENGSVCIRLNTPMTLKRFFKELSKMDKNVYIVNGNENISMFEGIEIHNAEELKLFLNETAGIDFTITRNGKYIKIDVLEKL